MRILLIGDIVGKPGRRILANQLQALRKEREIDFVVANGENAAAGSGLTPKIFNNLLTYGIDAVTTGDHIYKNKDVMECIDHPQLLRPHNYVESALGTGLGYYTCNEIKIGIINLQGRVFLAEAESPFAAIDKILSSAEHDAAITLVDFHAEATSEKIAMGWYLDGRVTAVVGTHTHVQTADERVLPEGTAYITDLGMTGSRAGVIGRDKDKVLHKFVTQMPARFEVCDGDVYVQGVLVTADPETGKALEVERLSITEEDSSHNS